MPSSNLRHSHYALDRRVDVELRMLADAIALVRSGTALRVTLGGLAFGDQLLERARSMAADSGLRVLPLYATDETAGTDLCIERLGAEADVASP